MPDIEKSVEIGALAWGPGRGGDYYLRAEDSNDWFWKPETSFNQAFRYLDLTNVLDLACGHGRHSALILDKAGHVTAMDVHQSNIDAVKARLGHHQNLTAVANNGYDFQPVEDNSLTSIFSYDAMVHFEPDVVGSYVVDAARVLKPGGLALFHHSNFGGTGGHEYYKNPHARNHMTWELFQQHAKKANLEILASTPIKWGSQENLDRLTTLRKPR